MRGIHGGYRTTKGAAFAAVLLGALALSGCATPTGPVEVTRFHRAEAEAQLGHGTISVEPAPGLDPNSLEIQSYERAVARELVRLGYTEAPAGAGAQIALIRIERTTFQPERNRNPVSVGGGASTGSYGSGIGLGIGIDLSGRPPAQVATRLGVMIRERASDTTLWEGRASFTVRADAPLAQTQLGAAKMAEAMFRAFPGNNGETVDVQ
ncbi:MAG TPA: DUF4136 domain-containing protein [Sphingomonadaceae bacterium]